MNPSDNEGRLSKLVADLDEEKTLAFVERHIAEGKDPLLIIDQCQQGMRQVGELYERGVYYISGLIMAGEIMHPEDL